MSEAMFMTLPPRPSPMRRRARFRLSSKIAIVFRATTAFQSSSKRSTAAPRRLMPAELTNISGVPHCATQSQTTPQSHWFGKGLKALREPALQTALGQLPRAQGQQGRGPQGLRPRRIAPGRAPPHTRFLGSHGDDGKLAFQGEGFMVRLVRARSIPANGTS